MGSEKNAAELEKERIKASSYLRQYGWHCTTVAYVRFLQVVPQVEESLMEILRDERLAQNVDGTTAEAGFEAGSWK